MHWALKITAANREEAVAIYRYLHKVFGVQKKDVEGVDATSFKVATKKEIAEIMIRAIKHEFRRTI